MRFFASLRCHWPLLVQSGLLSAGLCALYTVPPASGRMLLVPVTAHGRASLASLAVAHGARLIAAGPWAGSLLVEGDRDRLTGPLLRVGAVAIAARIGGCGEAA